MLLVAAFLAAMMLGLASILLALAIHMVLDLPQIVPGIMWGCAVAAVVVAGYFATKTISLTMRPF